MSKAIANMSHSFEILGLSEENTAKLVFYRHDKPLERIVLNVDYLSRHPRVQPCQLRVGLHHVTYL